jgi:hypothetical protein
MRTTELLLTALASIALSDSAQSQAPADPSPKIEKSCVGLSPQATQECLKVAKQMDRDATTPHEPATKPDSGNSPSPDTVHHSSPTMRTPDEIKADQKSRKAAESAKKSKPNPDAKPSPQPPQ